MGFHAQKPPDPCYENTKAHIEFSKQVLDTSVPLNEFYSKLPSLFELIPFKICSWSVKELDLFSLLVEELTILVTNSKERYPKGNTGANH